MINEEFAPLDAGSVSGMGDVIAPTSNQEGSGDTWDNEKPKRKKKLKYLKHFIDFNDDNDKKL